MYMQRLRGKDGKEITPVKAHPFTVKITDSGGKKYAIKCSYHDSVNHVNEWTVTHADSGAVITKFTSIDLAFSKLSKLDQAKQEVSKVVDKVGSTRFLSVIAGAPKFNDPKTNG